MNNIGQYPAPDYVKPFFAKEKNIIIEEITRDNIHINNNFLKDGRNIFTAGFTKMCDYVNARNNAYIPIGQMYEDGAFDNIFPVKESIKEILNKLIERLKNNQYCAIYSSDEDNFPNEIILKNKDDEILSVVHKNLCNYLKDFYSDPNKLIHDKNFPTQKKIISKFNIHKPASLVQIIENIKSEKFSDEAFGGTDQDKVICVEFTESDIDPFNILFNPDLEINDFMVNTVLKLITNFYNNNENINNLIRMKYEQTYGHKVNISIIDDIRRDLISHSQAQITKEEYFKWAHVFKEIIKNIIVRKEKKELMIIYKSLCLLYYYVYNSYIKQSHREIYKKNKRNDHIALIKQLVLDNASFDKEGRRLYKPVTLDEISRFNNYAKNKKIKDIYSDAEINNILYDPDSVLEHKEDDLSEENMLVPKILTVDNDGQTLYFHRWNIIDVFYSELINQKAQLEKSFIQQWTLDPSKAPKKSEFSIARTDMDSYFNQLLDMVHKYRSLCDIKQLEEIFFPSKMDMEKYELQNSSFSISSKEKKDKIALFLDNVLYKNKMLELKDFTNIFDLDFEEMIKDLNIRRSGFLNSFIEFFKKLFSSSRTRVNKISTKVRSMNEVNQIVDEIKELTNNKDIQRLVDSYKGTYKFYIEEQAKKRIKSLEKEKTRNVPHASETKAPKIKKKSKSDKEILKEIAPITQDQEALKSELNHLHEKWNMKLGNAREDLKNSIDQIIKKISFRFNVSQFKDENAERLANDIVNNNNLFGEIANQKALKRYTYLKALEFRLLKDQ